MPTHNESSIVVLDRFIEATRDSGYKGTSTALAELVDNSIQAGARRVWITIEANHADEQLPLTVSVLDDGCGMDKTTLRMALRFGGSSRFNAREGLGRYGMGLPNSSLSQARRVEVFSWTRAGHVLWSYLDVDEIVEGRMTEVPLPRPGQLPPLPCQNPPPKGTLVAWSKCDRLSNVRISTLAKKVSRTLGQVFRYFLWDGVEITINGDVVEPLDPLFLRGPNAADGTILFCEPQRYEIAVPAVNGAPKRTGIVTVTFTALPVHALHGLSNEEKRRRGIANGAGVSVIRAKREIDYGWYFLGGKRRENYDDWWRCEIAFDPDLDDAFGITHTKQQVRPQDYLTEILSPDLENMAKALNSHVRQAHLTLKANVVSLPAERKAAEQERLLKPLPPQPAERNDAIMRELIRLDPSLKTSAEPAGEDAAKDGGSLKYRVVQAKLKDTAFFNFAVKDGRLIVVINPDHPFHRKLYGPTSERDTPDAQALRSLLDLMLLSAARTEASLTRKLDREAIAAFRQSWSDALATFLNG